MSDKKTLILLAAIGSVIVSTTVPIMSFSQQQAAPGSNGTATDGGNATGGNLTTFEEEAMNVTQDSNNNATAPPPNATAASTSNATLQGNTTNGTTTAPSNATLARQQMLEQRIASSDAFVKNITSGNTKVLIITLSNQRGVPVDHEQRDIDPLGTIGFADDGASMHIQQPNYASGANLTSNLYPGGRLSFMFENLTMQPPDDIDVLFISPSDLRTPIAIDESGLDSSFRIPDTLENGHSYYVMVSMHWPDLHHDVVMGIKGKATVLQQPLE